MLNICQIFSEYSFPQCRQFMWFLKVLSLWKHLVAGVQCYSLSSNLSDFTYEAWQNNQGVVGWNAQILHVLSLFLFLKFESKASHLNFEGQNWKSRKSASVHFSSIQASEPLQMLQNSCRGAFGCRKLECNPPVWDDKIHAWFMYLCPGEVCTLCIFDTRCEL